MMRIEARYDFHNSKIVFDSETAKMHISGSFICSNVSGVLFRMALSWLEDYLPTREGTFTVECNVPHYTTGGFRHFYRIIDCLSTFSRTSGNSVNFCCYYDPDNPDTIEVVEELEASLAESSLQFVARPRW